jgi:hypothetical protein
MQPKTFQKELVMPGTIANMVGDIFGKAFDCGRPSGEAATLMNPLSALMNPLGAMVSREQKDGLSELKDLMREMIAEIHKRQDGTALVDIGGKDFRPGDLTAHFDPKMDQDINIYTGRGDDTVIIV